MSLFEVNQDFKISQKTAAAVIPPLSFTCQREILKILSNEDPKNKSCSCSGGSGYTWGKNYALVNWNWFRYCQILQGERFYCASKFTLKEEQEERGEFYVVNMNKQPKYHFSTHPYRYLKIEHVKYIEIHFYFIKSFVVQVINHQETNPSLQFSFEKIKCCGAVPYHVSKELVNLIRLGIPDLKLDFDLYFDGTNYNQQDYELSLFDINNDTTFSLETEKLKMGVEPRDYNGDRMQYEDIRSWIFMLNPKQLYLESYNGEAYIFMPLLHSIAKRNQRYESVTIMENPIPILALYRFLQAPNLHTLDIQLQFHQLFALYKGYKRYGGDSGNDKDDDYDYDDGDDDDDDDDDDDEYTKSNLSYQTFDKEYYDKNEDKLNEYESKQFCNLDEFNQIPISPNQPYSRDLWNKCRDLIKNHSTLKYLRISEDFCDECNKDAPKEFIQDFIEMFVNHKSIKILDIDVSFLSTHSKQQLLDQCQNNVNNNGGTTTIKQIILR